MFFRYAWLNLPRRKGRTLYAIIGIAISISVVVAVVSATRGVEAGIVSMLTEFRGDLIIHDDDVVGISDSRIDESLGEQIAEIDGITRVNPYIIQMLTVRFAGLTAETIGPLADLVPTSRLNEAKISMPVLGYPPDAFVFENEHIKTLMGSIRFSAPDAHEVLLGATVWRQLLANADRMRQRIGISDTMWDDLKERAFDPQWNLPQPVLAGVPFRIVGVFETGSLMDNQVIIPLATYQQIRPNYAGKVTAFLCLVEPGTTTSVAARVKEALPQLRPLDPRNIVRQFGDEYAKLQLLILAIGVLAGVGGAVSVLNTMASNVHERTREIGLLRAVGWTRRRLIASVIVEGVLISLVGGAAGIGLGVLELDAAEWIIGTNPNPQGLEADVVLLGLGISVALGIFGSLLPAWRASRLSPVEALRSE